MPTEVLVFAHLIPSDPGGDPQPCQSSFVTTGEYQDSPARVRVMDAGIALHGLAAGGWAEEALDEVLAEGPRWVLVPSTSPALVDALSARGVDLSEGTVAIADHGELSAQMTLNGVEIHAGPLCPLDHPGLLALQADGAAMADLLVARWEALSAHLGSLDPRAYAVRWCADGPRLSLIRMMRRLDQHRAHGRVPAVGVSGPDLPSGMAADPSGLSQLSKAWGSERELSRDLDDLSRRTCFSWLLAVRGGDESAAMSAAQAALGSASSWAPSFKRYVQARRPRVVVVPTWQCELRCRYCTIPKQGGRVMSEAVLNGSLDLLLSADAERYELHFFGGEPFLEWGLIEHAIECGEARAPGRIQYRFTTNGWALDADRLEKLSRHDVHLQLSLDGDRDTQNSARRPLEKGQDSYSHSPAVLASAVHELGLDHDLIQVVHPSNADRADQNFQHLVDLGYRRIQLNYALGARWSEEAKAAFAAALHRLGADLRDRWAAGQEVELVNLGETRMRVRTNREITVDWDGTVMSSNGFLYVPEQREHYVLGHLDDGHCFDRYVMDGPTDAQLLEWWYPPEITQNNQSVGAILMSFVRWMTQSEAGPPS